MRSERSLASLYAVVTSDPFLQSDALRSVLTGLRSAEPNITTVEFDGAEVELADVLDEVRMPSLWAGRRVVVVRDADALITRYRDKLEAYCGSPCEVGCLILLCGSLPKNWRIRRAIEGAGQLVEPTVPLRNGWSGWVRQRAQAAYGKSIDAGAAARLHEFVGDSLGQLDAELSKLAAFVGDRPHITAKDVENATGVIRDEVVFHVHDRVAQGDAIHALEAWHQVLATDRAAVGRALAGMAYSVRRRLESSRKGVPHWQRASAPTGGSPSTAQLADQQRDLLGIELGTKTGATTLSVAMEKFIVTHAAPTRQ